jgi:hypothetical protein
MTNTREYVESSRLKMGIDQEKVDLLAKEIDDTLKYALKSFSCKRVAGLEDSVMGRPTLNNSKLEDDDSLNFLEADQIGNKHFGPVIPEKDRATVIQVLEKLELLWEQKKFNRIHVLQNWRLVRLSERLKQTKNHMSANLILLEVFKKPLNNFYRILAVSKGMNLNLDFKSIPRLNHLDSKSQTEERANITDSSFIFNHSDIYEAGEGKLADELKRRVFLEGLHAKLEDMHRELHSRDRVIAGLVEVFDRNDKLTKGTNK